MKIHVDKIGKTKKFLVRVHLEGTQLEKDSFSAIGDTEVDGLLVALGHITVLESKMDLAKQELLTRIQSTQLWEKENS